MRRGSCGLAVLLSAPVAIALLVGVLVLYVHIADEHTNAVRSYWEQTVPAGLVLGSGREEVLDYLHRKGMPASYDSRTNRVLGKSEEFSYGACRLSVFLYADLDAEGRLTQVRTEAGGSCL